MASVIRLLEPAPEAVSNLIMGCAVIFTPLRVLSFEQPASLFLFLFEIFNFNL